MSRDGAPVHQCNHVKRHMFIPTAHGGASVYLVHVTGNLFIPRSRGGAYVYLGHVTGHLFTWDSNVGRRPTLNTPTVRDGSVMLPTGGLVRAVDVVGGGAARAQRGNEQRPERAAKQSTHRAVEQEVDRTVDEHRHVPDVAERRVDVVEDALVDAAEEGEDARRQLGHHEAQHDGDEHRRGAVVLAGLLRLEAASFHLQQATAAVGATHRHDQQRAENCQQDAGYHLRRSHATQRCRP